MDQHSQRPIATFLAGAAVGIGAAATVTAYLHHASSQHGVPRMRQPNATSLWQRLIALLRGEDTRHGSACEQSAATRDKLRAAAEARAAHAAGLGKGGPVAAASGHRADAQQQAARQASAAAAADEEEVEDEVLAEQFTRNTQFFGREGQARVAGSFVVVIGLGGVGSHAAAMLLRSGVRRLRLVDFDQVTLSSLNRHAVATRADVGLPKATVLAHHFAAIMPEAQVEPLVGMYTAEAEEHLLAGRPDFVIDAIDNIDTKVALLAACVRRKIPVLCCAGAGAKADPTRMRICDVAESTYDPLARAVRHRLRAQHGIDRGMQVLMSTERPRCRLVDNTGGAASLSDFQVVPNFRVRTIPVLGTMPALFGQAAAAHVLTQLACQPFTSESVFGVLPAAITAQLERLQEREEVRFGTAAGVLVDAAEVSVLIREVWRGQSARALAIGEPPSNDKGLTRRIDGLTLTRWDVAQPADVSNLVLLTFAEAEAHEEAGSEGLAALRQQEPVFVAFVEAKLDRAHREFFE